MAHRVVNLGFRAAHRVIDTGGVSGGGGGTPGVRDVCTGNVPRAGESGPEGGIFGPDAGAGAGEGAAMNGNHRAERTFPVHGMQPSLSH